MIELDGSVVLVTGRARGRRGHRGASAGPCHRGQLRAHGAGVPGGEFIACDVREPDQVAALVDEVVRRQGG